MTKYFLPLLVIVAIAFSVVSVRRVGFLTAEARPRTKSAHGARIASGVGGEGRAVAGAQAAR